MLVRAPATQLSTSRTSHVDATVSECTLFTALYAETAVLLALRPHHETLAQENWHCPHQLHPPQQTLSSRRRNSLPTATATLTVFMREWIGPRSPSVLRKGHTLSRSTMRVWTQKLNTSSRCCFSVASTRCGEFNLQLLHPSATFYENSITALAFY